MQDVYYRHIRDSRRLISVEGKNMKNNNNFVEKSYDRCIPCHHRKENRCNGPRTSAMELKRWCEFMRDMKEANGLSNAYIAEESGVSIKTIDRLMALHCDQDIMRENARRIEAVIMGSSNNYPCYQAYEELMPDNSQQLATAMIELERALADNRDYKTALDNIHASYREEMEAIRDEAQKKIDFLLDEVNRLRSDAEHWRAENDRKGKLIDTYLDKMLQR